MAAGGGSYGGYLATLILGRPAPVQGPGRATPAVYNWYSQIAADCGGRAPPPRRSSGRARQSRQMLEKSSPHLGAANFKTPTLVVHGEKDYRVPVNHGLELYHTLQNKGVPTRLLYFPDENHWILKPQNSLHWYSAVRDWIQQHASPGPSVISSP